MNKDKDEVAPLIHESAQASHYDKEALHYDAFNEERPTQINQLIETILKQHRVNSVLDLTCGTGLQVFWLMKRGFHVVGSDINETMLQIAKEKAIQEKLKVELFKGDMRTTQAGHFDAVLTIFNAIGHLTKSDFEMALKNIHHNLNDNGVYLFDIFNLDYLLHEDNITKLTIDWLKKRVTLSQGKFSTAPSVRMAFLHLMIFIMNKEALKSLQFQRPIRRFRFIVLSN